MGLQGKICSEILNQLKQDPPTPDFSKWLMVGGKICVGSFDWEFLAEVAHYSVSAAVLFSTGKYEALEDSLASSINIG